MSFLQKISNSPAPKWFLDAFASGENEQQLKDRIKQVIKDELPSTSKDKPLWNGDNFDKIAETILTNYMKNLKPKR